MAKYIIIFQQDHTVEIPATILETRTFLETRTLSDGSIVSSINIPASIIKYKKGQVKALVEAKYDDCGRFIVVVDLNTWEVEES